MESVKKDSGSWGSTVLIGMLFFGLIGGVLFLSNRTKELNSGSWVEPYVTTNGKAVPGHYRKNFSTDPNAVKNRIQSKYYYHTQGKYKRKK